MTPIIGWTLRNLRRIILAALFLALVGALMYAAAPMELAYLFAGDAITWLEAATTVYLASRVTRIKPALDWMRLRLAIATRRIGRRARRARRPRRLTPPPGDDGLAFA
ncbi:MAG: hypothetical protein WDN44_06750 [Sphingomonas sp.]